MGLTCLLLGANAGAEGRDMRASFKTDYREQRFEQIIAASVDDLDYIPAEGRLKGPYLSLVDEAARPNNNFKFASWVLCVSSTSEENGTVLLIDSVQLIQKPEKNGPDLIVYYRRAKAPGIHSMRQVWPYAVLVAYGWHEKVSCRAATE
ncbi:hypothetical protein D7X12_01425 [Corallococcus sicarius]|uniref:Uncharacterized protein n=2 Tax=Corallococcus sicarius TaxID=2316726 RepID=A0A3A8P607_9BACT|nr:hypothetical protein D7X12_01425 [Corallococcus sicarius]